MTKPKDLEPGHFVKATKTGGIGSYKIGYWVEGFFQGALEKGNSLQILRIANSDGKRTLGSFVTSAVTHWVRTKEGYYEVHTRNSIWLVEILEETARN